MAFFYLLLSYMTLHGRNKNTMASYFEDDLKDLSLPSESSQKGMDFFHPYSMEGDNPSSLLSSSFSYADTSQGKDFSKNRGKENLLSSSSSSSPSSDNKRFNGNIGMYKIEKFSIKKYHVYCIG